MARRPDRHRGTAAAWIGSLGILILAAPGLRAQPDPRSPRIGYIFPAGARSGSSPEVLIGGQSLRKVLEVHVTGEGVTGTIVRFVEPLRGLNKEVMQAIKQRLRSRMPGPLKSLMTMMADPDSPEVKAAEALDHPLFAPLKEMDLEELAYMARVLRNPHKRQPSPQIAETVVIRMSVDGDAATGDREIRLRTPAGLSNPLLFEVGTEPEVTEHEPDDPDWPRVPSIELPVVLNGRILSGDTDRFRFRVSKGQRLLFRAHARRLIPYLADAVPGWFQATLAIHDDRGLEVAFADDTELDPDPVLRFEAPRDGDYDLRIRDALDRGRLDFVYRIMATPDPDAGAEGTPGGKAAASQTDVALPLEAVVPDVTNLSRIDEVEPNDDTEHARSIRLPAVVVGSIARPGDRDMVSFEGRAGDPVVAEVLARRLGSPVDALLHLIGPDGTVVAWNDDHPRLNVGWQTHHADAWLAATLPLDGLYMVQISDSQRHGGDRYHYLLRLSPPRPDFTVLVAPSSVNVPAPLAGELQVHVERRDGFQGDVEVALKDPPPGVVLGGGRIPGGRDSIRMTLSAPLRALDPPVALEFKARARIGDARVTRPVLAADEWTQAFLYRHLVPSRVLMATSRGARRVGKKFRLEPFAPVRIPAGGEARVMLAVPRARRLPEFDLELSDPPGGLTLGSVTREADGLAIVLKAGASSPAPGLVDNLIVSVVVEWSPAGAQDPAAPKKRIAVGVLPAIPIEIVR